MLSNSMIYKNVFFITITVYTISIFCVTTETKIKPETIIFTPVELFFFCFYTK